MSVAVYSLFNSGRWNDLKRSPFLTVKFQNPENLIIQHLPVEKKFINLYKNNSLVDIKRMRNGIITDTLTRVDIGEVVKC